jgi:Zn-dependent protease
MEGNAPWLGPVAPRPALEAGERSLPRAGEPPAAVVVAPPSEAFGAERRPLRKRIGSGLAVVVALAAKFAAQLKAILLLAPKFKLLTTAGTALVSVAAYALFWGWSFAVGFVVLLFVHEMGHVVALRREGIKASAPMFVPFLGALISARSLGENALDEARVGLAGPILGTVAAALCIPLYVLTGNHLFLALAYVGFFLNLFNLLPVVPLDGGRAMAAMAPWMWFVGYAALIVLAFVFPNPIMLIILLFGGMEVLRRWKARKTRTLEQAAYYLVSGRYRALVAVVYIGLIALLVAGMDATYVVRTLS